MPAEVESMFYVSNENNNRFVPWHGLGTSVETAPNSKEAIKLAGLDWKVNQHELKDGFTNITVPNYKVNVRSTDNQILGIVSDRYKIVQNDEAFDFTDNLIGNGVKYETAGSLFNGKKVWLLARMPVKKLLDDDVDPYICFSNTFDGSGSIKVAMTPVRVVCNNTLNLAMKDARRTWSTRHLGDISSKLAEAKETLLLADDYMNHLQKEAAELASKKISKADVDRMINELFPTPSNASNRKVNNIDEQKSAVYVTMLAPDLANYVGTAWQFVNAISDFVGHHKPNRMTDTYQEGNWNSIMSGNSIFDKAYSMVKEIV